MMGAFLHGSNRFQLKLSLMGEAIKTAKAVSMGISVKGLGLKSKIFIIMNGIMLVLFFSCFKGYFVFFVRLKGIC